MAYQINRDTIETSIKNIAVEQIDKAVSDIRSSKLDIHEKVHNSRVRCKNIRGLLRLVRNKLKPSYQEENIYFRDCANLLSDLRDSQSIIEAFDKIINQFEDHIQHADFCEVHEVILEHRTNITANKEAIESKLDMFMNRMTRAHARIDHWKVGGSGYHCVKGGLKNNYSRGKKVMEVAYSSSHSNEDYFHEWRKYTKYHGHHLKLLRPVWPKPMEARLIEVETLSGMLGDDHDLTILSNLLNSLSEESKNNKVIKLLNLIDQQKVHLRKKAKALGLKIYAESAKRFSDRIGIYWSS